MPYLVGVRGAHEDDWTILGHLPATPGVYFAEEELDQYGEGPEEGIVDVFVHGRNGLLALGLLHHCCGAASPAVGLAALWYVCGGRGTCVAIVG